MLARKDKVWSVQPLSWTSEHPCFRFNQDGRLTAVQLWTGHGGISIVVYGIYGPSGARWETPKRQYFHSMLQAIEHDRIERGHFNLELDDSYPLKQCLRSRFWFDARERALPDNRDLPTCHVGKGSKIDHLFVSSSIFDQTFDFDVQNLPEFKDHSLVTAQIYAPAAAQMKTTLRQVCEIPKLTKRTQNYNPLPSQISAKFSEAIVQNDVDQAFKS